MSDDEVEGFEITDWDLDNEFNPNRVRRRMTKEQQMIGVFADDSDEERAPKPAFKRFEKKGPKGYQGPVRFVSAGIQQAGKKKEEAKKDDNQNDDDDVDDDDDDTARARRGDADYVPNSSSESEEDDSNSRPSNVKKTFSLNTDSDIAGLRKKRAPMSSSIMKTGMGGWETYTKGIASQILLGMGYEPGKGLGKNQQGITAPVEVHLRKGRGAIGAYGPEKKTKIQEQKKDEDLEEEKEFKVKLSQWRKGGTGGDVNSNKKKIKYHYRSVDQVLEDGKLRPNIRATPGSELSRVKVIDMTGPEQRVLSGYHAIAGQKYPDELITEVDNRRSTTNFSLPELQHNLNLIVDMCEQNIIQNDRKKRYLSDRIVSLEAEQKSTAKIVDHHEKLIDTLDNVLSIVDKLMNSNEDMSLKEIADAFKKIQDKYYDEYKINDLGELASSIVSVKIKNNLATWNPLVDTKYPLNIIKEWKDILETGNNINPRNGMNPYDRLIWNAWMPSVRGAVQQWACREPDGIIDLIENWMPLLPSWIMDNILELLILPKLTLAVEEWNPLTDTVPIHTWIHPWLPLLGNRMDTLIYPIIRRKLGSALGVWYPSDRSARLMLQPWAQVFSKGDMDAFLVKNILPKLEIALSQFDINPREQHMELWRVVYEWSTLLPNHTMVGLLDKYFFPNWLRTLAMWLNLSPNYEEVSKWYTGWKNELSDKLLAEPTIKEWFKKALELMNRALRFNDSLDLTNANILNHQASAMENVSYRTNLERSQATMTQIPAMTQPQIERLAEVMRSTKQMPEDFKDLVQLKLEERGILFVPITNQYRDSKQVYRVGETLKVYVNGSVLYVCHNGNNFNPSTLQNLLDIAEGESKTPIFRNKIF
ncbi:hypothetical protein HCN44_010477 [Aphidius gifuensis]|uniref:G-patch domain-containing protein n=1 Tax=Aphidius gifuensis TaxID=684658 RepID=A0A834XRV6_APHGI|nr:tuftelin-interacting protein 11 [Aphidius gifuensis]KAF7991676.1 hypothetical protein HCN44_010477 [Aphidius gifuensis]